GNASPLHRTNSLDYGVVLSGIVKLELDGGKFVDLAPGDVVVQRGTIHAWHNPGPEWARMVFFMADAKPATAGGVTLEPEFRQPEIPHDNLKSKGLGLSADTI
ncbi:MAG: cupin domain-containing protein, partial [Rhodospirillales bacterium]|nr:cupin domain-containing protein [Rhodospirillales bacterium]